MNRHVLRPLLRFAVLCFAAPALALVARPVAPPAAGAGISQMVVAYYIEPDTLNPYATHVLSAKELDVVEGFEATDDQMQYLPHLVREVPNLTNGGVKLTADAMTVTWRLKPGLKWSDGQPVTSADAAFTYKTMIDPSFRVDSRAGWGLIAAVDTPDPLTVVARFKEPYGAYRDLFRYLLPKHVLDGHDINTYAAYNRSPVTTAPYVVQEWVPGQYLTTVANPNYRDAAKGLPHIKKIVWRFVSDSNTRINMLRTREAQIAWALPFDQIKPLQSASGIKVVVHPLNAWMHFDFNLHRTLFQDVRLRQAVAYAVNKQDIVAGVLGGLGRPAGPPVTPLSWAYNPNAYKQYRYDAAKAKQLIAEAGWAPGTDGIVRKDGKPLAFTNCNSVGDATQDRVQQVIQAELRAVGLGMQIHNYSPTVYGQIRFQGECDTLFHRWIVPAYPSLSQFYASDAMPPNGLNEDFYASEEFTDTIRRAERTIDQPAAKKLFWQAQEILGRDLPSIPIYYLYGAQATTTQMRGLVGNPTNDGDGWNMEQWVLEP
ncbi:MAG TPA: peptide ABC transporter substrate-binding protein [bacterium]|nr:peptide ABC transporter substrate-binding protein [bacterium]